MDPPPRQTSKIPLPEDTIIRKSVFGRAVTGFSDENDPRYSELKCGSAITQIVNDSHVFHSHELNGRKEWNRPTKIACYHCCHQFKTAPIPIPKKYDSLLYMEISAVCRVQKHTFSTERQVHHMHLLCF